MKNYTRPSKKEHLRLSDLITSCYFKPKDIRVQKNTIGYINNTFLLKLDEQNYIVRESNPSTSLEHLKFEADVLDYLQKKRFPLTPKIIPNSIGEYITLFKGKFYILQTVLPGEAVASWNNLQKFKPAQLIPFFAASAKFTRAVRGYRKHQKNNKHGIWYYSSNASRTFLGLKNEIKSTPAYLFLNKEQGFLDSFINQTKLELQNLGYDKLPKQVVHFDLHPGNFHFEKTRVTGLFDFDWIRYDCRISDFAATIGQSCYFEKGPKKGIYKKQYIEMGCKSYRTAYGKSEFSLEKERLLLKAALQGYMLFQFLWVVEWYKTHHKQKSAFSCLQFFFNILKRNNFEELFI